VRNIQVINGGKVKELDVYEYLFNPQKQSDYYLQSNDILYVPFIGDLVEIKGSVKQVGVFEMKNKETFPDLLEYAGGYLNDALEDEIQLVRKNKEGSFVKEYSGKELSSLTFEDGDKVIISTQTSDKKDYVEINGWVDYPGIYGIRDYPTIKQVLQKVGIREETRMDVAYLTRTLVDGTRKLIQFSPEAQLALEDSLALVLLPEDQITVFNIRDFIDNATVAIEGAVRQPGTFALDESANVAFLIDLAKGLKQDAKLDLAYLFRENPDGTTEIETLNLEDILNGNTTVELRDKDVLRVLSEKAFVDASTVKIVGAVRNPTELTVDSAVTVKALIDLANGLKKDARLDKAYIFRTYPDGSQEVLTLDLASEIAVENPTPLMDEDEVRILSERTFYDGATLSISGEVRNQLEIPYDSTITLNAVLELAGGLTFAGDSTKIIVYRIAFDGKDIGKVKEFTLDSRISSSFTFEPFDGIVVRKKPGFEYQEYVNIRGEVAYPGRYAIENGERVGDLIKKAGGLTKEAFPQAATFNREGQGKIFISIDRILKLGNTYQNIELLPGDDLFVPSKDMTVEIRLANTEADRYREFANDYDRESVRVAYVAGKNARWYVKNMVGGFGDDAKRTKTNVVYANGTVKGYKWYKLTYRYPKVKPGSIVTVGAKPPKKEKEQKADKEPLDWQQFTSQFTAQVTSLLTIYYLSTTL